MRVMVCQQIKYTDKLYWTPKETPTKSTFDISAIGWNLITNIPLMNIPVV